PNQRAQALVLTPDGTVIVVGKSLETGSKVEGLVVAFDPNGALLGGEKVDASTTSTVYAGAAVESALSVIAVGEADNGLASRIDVLDGTLDPNYGDGGLGNVEGKDKKATTCHDVLVIGSRTLVTCKAGTVFDLIALQPDSTLDTTFGTNGSALAPASPSGSQEPWTTVATSDRLIQVGVSAPSVQPRGVAVRVLLTTGAPDPTFADGGVATYAPSRQGSTGAQAFSAVVTDAGLWMGGTIELDSNRRGLVMRIDPSTGAVDPKFAAGDGVSSPQWPANQLVVRKLAVQGDRVIAAALAGSTFGEQTSLDVVLIRYVP
ncbi:MAG TPA: hypothetical protein VIF62_37590, partial [Labilithrix sp.]